MQIAREDFIASLAGRETKGGVAFSNGLLYISSEAGLEIYDLRNVRAGGSHRAAVHQGDGRAGQVARDVKAPITAPLILRAQNRAKTN